MTELPNIGDRIAERYEVGALVEQTPAYTSFRALDRDVEVDVALWLMKPELYPDDRRKDAFIGAVVDMRGLIHPHLRRLYDAGRSGEQVYLTTQLSTAEGMLLRLGSGRIAPEIDVVRYANAIAEAMDAAHKLGHVHGWMVPWDVVQVAGQIKVGGVGLYRDIELAGARACWRESERYIAPEVLEAGIATPSSDVYSMAAVLVEIASGVSVPDLGEATEALAAEHIKLADVLAQGLAIAPERRPRSAGAFAHRIRELMVDERVPTAERKAEPPPLLDAADDTEDEVTTVTPTPAPAPPAIAPPGADSSAAITSPAHAALASADSSAAITVRSLAAPSPADPLSRPRRTARLFAPVDSPASALPRIGDPEEPPTEIDDHPPGGVTDPLARYVLPVSNGESSELPTMHEDPDTFIMGAPPPPIVVELAARAPAPPPPAPPASIVLDVAPPPAFVSQGALEPRRREHTPIMPLEAVREPAPAPAPVPRSPASRLWLLVIGVAVVVAVAIAVTYAITGG